MVSQPDLVLPAREPERGWDWGGSKRERGKAMDSWADCASAQTTSREEGFVISSSAGRKQPAVQTRGRDAAAADPEKKTEGCFSGPPSPAFSLDSNSPFANGFLEFESSLFEDDGNNEEREAASPAGGLQDKHESAGSGLQSAPGDLTPDPMAAQPSAKVVTRSQSSGQRRRYWDGSDDEWDSDTELFLLGDSYSRHSMASFTVITLELAHHKGSSMVFFGG